MYIVYTREREKKRRKQACVCARVCEREKEREREEGKKGRGREKETRAQRKMEERLEKNYTAAGWRVLKLRINIFINTNHIKMYRASLEKRGLKE